MDKPVDHGHSIVVKTVARVVARLMLLFGMYIVLHGQVTHGGGFAGGMIMALVFILIMLAYGREATLKIFSRSAALAVAGSGVFLLIMIAFLGYGCGYFFANFMGPGWPYEFWSAGVIPFLNIAIGLLVVGSLYGIFAALSIFHSDQGYKP